MVWAEWPPDMSDALSCMGDVEQEKRAIVRHLQNQRKVDNGKRKGKGRGYLLPIKCPVFCLWHSLSSLRLFTLFPLNNKCEQWWEPERIDIDTECWIWPVTLADGRERERQTQSGQDGTAALHNADLYYIHIHALHVPILPCGGRPYNDWAVDDRLTRASNSTATRLS